MRVIYYQVLFILSAFARNVYWILNACRIETGKNISVPFPLKFSGKGSLKLKGNVQIMTGAVFSIETGSRIELGENSKIGNNVEIHITGKSTLLIGSNTAISSSTICIAHNDWILGDNVKIASYCQIFSRESGCKGSLELSSDCHVGDYSILDLSDNVIIGKCVAIGPRCTIYTHDHNYRELGILAPWKGMPQKAGVTIGDKCWIGSNVTILPGVSIGEGAIVATGSVVKRDIPAYTLWAGVPARLIKSLENE